MKHADRAQVNVRLTEEDQVRLEMIQTHFGTSSKTTTVEVMIAVVLDVIRDDLAAETGEPQRRTAAE